MFPLFFINNCIKKNLYKFLITHKSSKSISDKMEIFICLDFLGKIPLQSKKQLINIFRTCRKKMQLKAVFLSSKKIHNAFRLKDQIPIYVNSNVI